MTVTYNDPAVTYDDATITYAGDGYVFDDIHVTTEFAFGSEPLNTAPVWQPVTAYVRGVNIDRGRTAEHSTYSPGSAIIRLDNRDRRFDPEYTAGPFYGDLVPMVPVRITATRAGNTYTMFTGFVKGWPSAYDTANTDAVATVQCVDATRLLRNMPLPQSDYYNAVVADTPLHYWPLQEPTRERHTDVIQGLVGTLQREPDVTFDSVKAGAKYVDGPVGADAIPYAVGGGTLIDLSMQGPFPQSKVRAMEMWFEFGERVGNPRIYVANEDQTELFRASIIRVPTGTPNFLVDMYSVVDDYHIPQYSVNYTPRTGMNHFVVSYDETTGVIEIALNGATIDSRSMTSGPGTSTFTPPGSIFLIDYENTSHAALYEFALPAARRAAHYNAGNVGNGDPTVDARYTLALTDGGFPSTFINAEPSTQDVAALRDATSLLDYARQLEAAEQSAFYVDRSGVAQLLNRATVDTVNVTASFDDTDDHLPFTAVVVDSHTVEAIRNTITGQFRAPFNDTKLSVSDTASVAAYGESVDRVDLLLFDVEADAEAALTTRLERFKNPRTRIKQLDINLRSDTAALLPVLAQMELMDDVTVAFTPTNVGAPLWRAVRVQGVRHRISGSRWSTRLYLDPGPISINGPLIVLDDDTYGKLSDGNKLG